jgi:hypothetical protein
MEFEGVIVHQPPAKRTYSGRAVYGSKDWFELSRDELDVLLPRCAGVPVRTEHGTSVVVGSVAAGFYNSAGDAAVRFKFHDTDVGRNAYQLVQSGLMRGLSLCHQPDTLEVREVSICFEGARPRTGITSEVVRASGVETNPLSYKLQTDGVWIKTFTAGGAVSIPSVMASQGFVGPGGPTTAMMSMPTGLQPPQQQQMMMQPANQQQQLIQPTIEEQQLRARLLQQQQQQQQQQQMMMQSAGMYQPQAQMGGSVPAGVMTLSVPQAAQYAHQILQNTNGTPFQPLGSTAVPEAATTSVSMNQEPSAAARTAPTPSAATPPAPGAAAATTPAETPSGDDAFGRKRKAPDPTAEKGASETTEPADTKDDVVAAVVKHRGALSDAMRTKLLDEVTNKERRLQSMEAELKQLKEERDVLSENANSLRGQFTETVIPFMRTILGKGAFSSKDEEDMRNVVKSKEALPFLAKWGEPLSRTVSTIVAASALGQSMGTASGAVASSGNPELQKKLELYRALQQGQSPASTTSSYTTSLNNFTSSAPSAPAMTSVAATNQFAVHPGFGYLPPMPLMPQDAAYNYGWQQQPQSLPTTYVAASSSQAPQSGKAEERPFVGNSLLLPDVPSDSFCLSEQGITKMLTQ